MRNSGTFCNTLQISPKICRIPQSSAKFCKVIGNPRQVPPWRAAPTTWRKLLLITKAVLCTGLRGVSGRRSSIPKFEFVSPLHKMHMCKYLLFQLHQHLRNPRLISQLFLSYNFLAHSIPATCLQHTHFLQPRSCPPCTECTCANISSSSCSSTFGTPDSYHNFSRATTFSRAASPPHACNTHISCSQVWTSHCSDFG